MNNIVVFWPMGALALLTFAVLGLLPIRRIAAALRGELTPDDFRDGESARVSSHVSRPNRAMMNLLELPVLFYTICLMAFVSDRVTEPFLWLAWIYVALRCAHAVILMTYNNVIHRLIPYAASNVALIAMWVMFFVGLS